MADRTSSTNKTGWHNSIPTYQRVPESLVIRQPWVTLPPYSPILPNKIKLLRRYQQLGYFCVNEFALFSIIIIVFIIIIIVIMSIIIFKRAAFLTSEQTGRTRGCANNVGVYWGRPTTTGARIRLTDGEPNGVNPSSTASSWFQLLDYRVLAELGESILEEWTAENSLRLRNRGLNYPY